MARLLWLCIPLAALAPSSARAQSAEALLAEGLAARQAGRDAEAAEAFERAYAAAPTAEALAQLALAEQALGRWPEAEAHLSAALASDEAFVEDNRAVLEGALTTIRAHLGQLFVEANVDGARVSVDGRAVGTTPIEGALHVPAGTMVVTVEAPGHFRVTREATVSAGGPPARVSVTLVPLAGAGEPEASEPEAGGAAAPAREPRPAPQPGGVSALLVVGLASAGLTAVALGGAIGAAAVREDHVQRYTDDVACPPTAMGGRSGACPDAYATFRTAEDWAIAGAVVGGALGVAAAVLIALGLAPSDPEGALSLTFGGIEGRL